MNTIIKSTEPIQNPLTESELAKKGLCDYVVNVASGCLHQCLFCYVPSTPTIRMRSQQLKDRGVTDPAMDWGQYLFVRTDAPAQLKRQLENKRAWKETPAGKGVVLLCSTTDPYQNRECAEVTRQCVKLLLSHGKRVRILTRSPLWILDLDLLSHPNCTIGMSIPHLDDKLSRQIEPKAPLPSDRLKAMFKGRQAGCRLFVAMAPTPPIINVRDFYRTLKQLAALDPEVIFWEPINARGSNGKRMLAAGLDWAEAIGTKESWKANFLNQWEMVEDMSEFLGISDLIHYWPDTQLGHGQEWIGKPTIEEWK